MDHNREVLMQKYRICIFSLAFLITVSSISVAQDREEIAERLTRIIEQYMNVKDALVHNREDLSAAWAERLETTLATTPDEIFEEEEVSYWQGSRGVMLDAAGSIVDADSREAQREALNELSIELRSLIETFGNPGDTLYVLACSDYDEENDVFWLNNSEQVANPYHGPEKLDCGRVIGEL